MKDGDLLLEKLRQAVDRRDKLAILVFAAEYSPPWWYWMEFEMVNHN